MVPMSVEEIAKAVDGRLIGDADSESRATNTVSDSRQAGPPAGLYPWWPAPDRCLWPSEASVSMGMTLWRKPLDREPRWPSSTMR